MLELAEPSQHLDALSEGIGDHTEGDHRSPDDAEPLTDETRWSEEVVQGGERPLGERHHIVSKTGKKGAATTRDTYHDFQGRRVSGTSTGMVSPVRRLHCFGATCPRIVRSGLVEREVHFVDAAGEKQSLLLRERLPAGVLNGDHDRKPPAGRGTEQPFDSVAPSAERVFETFDSTEVRAAGDGDYT